MKNTNRDFHILKDCSLNIAPLSHIAMRHFPTTKKASRRMKMLFENGLVRRFVNPVNPGIGKGEYIYYLSAKGRDVLRQQFNFHVEYLLNPLKDVYTIPHRLMVAEFQIALMADPPEDYKVTFHYLRGTQLRSADMGNIIPDGILIVEKLSTGKRLLMFIEIDLGTEPLTGSSTYTLRQKLEKYLACFDSTDAQKKINEALGYQFNGFRVLMTSGSKRRSRNIFLLTKKLGIEFFWITESISIKSQKILDPVWGNYKYQNLSLIAPYPGKDLDGDLGGDLLRDQTPTRPDTSR